jgi:lipopolysaccharide transport system permease protein
MSSDGLPRPLFYMAGVTAWNYFSDCLNKTSSVFATNASLFGKVYFPRLVVPFSIIISNLMRFLMQMLMFVVLLIYFQVNTNYTNQMGWAILWFPFLVILMALLGLGLGMIVSAFTTKYKDLQYLMQFGVTLMMYATPIIFPLSAAPEKYRYLIELNPMTGIIETFRYAFLGKGIFSLESIGYSTIFTFVSLFIGIIVFNRTERTFIDTI